MPTRARYYSEPVVNEGHNRCGLWNPGITTKTMSNEASGVRLDGVSGLEYVQHAVTSCERVVELLAV